MGVGGGGLTIIAKGRNDNAEVMRTTGLTISPATALMMSV